MMMTMRNFISQIPHHLFVFLVLLLMSSLVSGLNHRVGAANAVRCIERERQALLAFRKGIEYDLLSSWGNEPEKKECCEWEGVRCNNTTGHLVTLDLGPTKKRALIGKISHSLMELHELRYLDLSVNLFYGRIPYHLGNLSHLHYLNLSNNYGYEVGNLKWLSNLSSLQHLDLSFTNVSPEEIEWPKVFGRLTKLATLKLAMCGLISPSILHWLSNSTSNLAFLDLSANELTGPIPDSLGHIHSLVQLDLRVNQLEGEIPISFGNLCNLQSLDLSQNNLRGHIGFISNLYICARPSLLKNLKLSMNKFSGSIPDLSVLPSLKEIDLSGNDFNGSFPNSIGNLLELEYLDVSSNNWSDIISESYLLNFSKLMYLGLSGTHLNISSNWVPPFQLRILILRSCKLRGPYDFPIWLQTQRNMEYLDISSLEISDSIPHWFWNITSNMILLNLSNNNIYGMLPSSLRNIEKLSLLDLSSNHLEGPLPTIRHPNSTLSLGLSNNKFSGSILPLCFFGPNILDLSNNNLSGVIPNYCLTNWSHLTVLDLSHNNFSGRIPSSLGSLTRLQTLALDNNNFFGKLPSSMEKCEALTFMDLGDNKLSGRLPAWIGERLLALKILILRSNKFHGRIPGRLCQLQQLQILDLSHNNMSGNIPECFSNFTAMTHSANRSEQSLGVSFVEANPLLEFFVKLILYSKPLDQNDWWSLYTDEAEILWRGRADLYGKNLVLLRVIDLSSNHLVGNIPGGLLNLSGLVALNLSANNLSGSIPRNIGQLNQLQSLDLSQNQFSGEIPASMASLHFLSHLNMSYNKLSGEIPSGTQLQGFDVSAYMENQALCGQPLANNCSSGDDQDVPPSEIPVASINEEDEFKKWLYIGASSGFAVSFWGVCGILFFNRASRVAYFSFVNRSTEWLLVTISIHKARLLKTLG